MSIFVSFVRVVNNLTDWVGKVFSFLIYGMVLILVFEVVARYVFNSPTIWAHESSEFLYAVHFMVGGAFALRFGGHIKIEIIYGRFPPRAKAIVDLVTWVLFYIVCGLLAWHGAEMAVDSVKGLERTMSVWAPPYWPVKSIIAVAFVLILLQGSTKTIKDAYTAITGREFSVEVGKGA